MLASTISGWVAAGVVEELRDWACPRSGYQGAAVFEQHLERDVAMGAWALLQPDSEAA